MTSLVLAGALFISIHLFVSGTRLRDGVTGVIGESAFQGLFSLASLGAIVWLCMAYGRAPVVVVWPQLDALRPIMYPALLVAALLVVIGLTTPSPTVMGGESRLKDESPATGIIRITRHPFLWGVTLWSATHLVLNGDAASIVLFGTFLVVALLGPSSIDAKRRRRFGGDWDRFAAATSNLPFLAIVQGRNRLALNEVGWWRVLFGLAIYEALLHTHGWLFGVSPFIEG